MSAEAAPAVVPQEQKVVDVPPVEAAHEEPKAAEPAVEATPAPVVAEVTSEPAKVEEPAASTTEAAATTEAATSEITAKDDAAKEEGKKSPSLLAKLLAPFKHEKKVKTPKSPKKEKKEEVKATEEPAVATETAAVPAAEPVAAKEEPAPVKETEAAAAEPAPAVEETAAATATEEPVKTEERRERPKPSAVKMGRRLSSRVSDLFTLKKEKKAHAEETPKVEEAAPQLAEPAPVAPLDTAAPTTTAAVTEAAKEEPKAAEAPAAAPVVAAAA